MMIKAAWPCPCRFSTSTSSFNGNRAVFLFTIKKQSYSKFNVPPSQSIGRKQSQLCPAKPKRFSVSASAASTSQNCDREHEPSFIRNTIAAMVKHYLEKNPTAVSALRLIKGHDEGPICYDHFAFRSFGINGCGIGSISQIFLDMGYETRDELRFPAKKLRALWFAPPKWSMDSEGEEINGPLPRIFVSELLVDQLSPEAQTVIRKYVEVGAPFAKHAAASSVLNCLTWPTPTVEDYDLLAKESEYAAWTLVNGYALNHLTVSVHRLASDICKIERLNQFIEDNGIKLNSDGGKLKVSPDGKLLQSSTVADSQEFCFAGDKKRAVPACYIEFAERLVLPEFAGLPASEIKEWHRRDGFEVGNADKIFESTSSSQTGFK